MSINCKAIVWFSMRTNEVHVRKRDKTDYITISHSSDLKLGPINAGPCSMTHRSSCLSYMYI